MTGGLNCSPSKTKARVVVGARITGSIQVAGGLGICTYLFGSARTKSGNVALSVHKDFLASVPDEHMPGSSNPIPLLRAAYPSGARPPFQASIVCRLPTCYFKGMQ